jgi:hypothetical protein
MGEHISVAATNDIESRYGIELPPRHRAALADAADPIHGRVVLLAAERDGERETIFSANENLRKTEWKEWPACLLAFATNGCGDYFAYDLRHHPYPVYYIGPIGTTPDEMATCEQEDFVFPSFDQWYRYLVLQSETPTPDDYRRV